MREELRQPADLVMSAVEAVTGERALRYLRTLRERGIVPAGKRGPHGHHPDIGVRETAFVLLAILSGESTRRAASSISDLETLSKLPQLERVGKTMYGDPDAVRRMAEDVVTEGRSGAAMAGILDRFARKVPGMRSLQLVALQRAGNSRCFVVRVQDGKDAGDVQFGYLPENADDGLVTTRALGARGLEYIANTLCGDAEH